MQLLLMPSSYAGQVGENAKKDLKEGLALYNTENNVGLKNAWNIIQAEWKCCGVTGYADWYEALKETAVPDRCCQEHYQDCGRNSTNLFWQRGCYEKVEEWLDDSKHVLGTIGMCILVIQILGMAFSMTLFQQIHRTDTRILIDLYQQGDNGSITELVFSLLIIAIGVYAKVEKATDTVRDTFLIDPAIILIVVGVVMFFITFCGCIGALRENIKLLKATRGTLGKFVKKAIIHYRDDIDLQNLIDYIQKEVVINTMCGFGVQNLNYLEATKSIYPLGCADKTAGWIESHLLLVGALALGLVLPQRNKK
ncbi:Tetraspanin-9 [Acipenser ruthenus]|uniref:Tetraspanin-9 n=1 Tax=Acipenser ruthenus TaxID=7906 RepID=A0A662YZB4_ACIRT|nr:Tetraspanin-9 [Acipenser ruthenus]